MKFVLTSENRKLGRWKMACTYRPTSSTCPTTCALKGNGCYAERGRVGMIQQKLSSEVDYEALEQFIGDCARLGRLIRHHVSGDFLLPDGSVDMTYLTTLVTLHERYQVCGYLYTHLWRVIDPDWFNENGYLVANASVDNLDEVQDAIDLGWYNVTITVPPDTVDGWYEGARDRVLVRVCPADLGKDITCAQCKMCARSSRGFAIGFVSKNATSHAVVMDAWTERESK